MFDLDAVLFQYKLEVVVDEFSRHSAWDFQDVGFNSQPFTV